MSARGEDIVRVARTRIGDRYVLGAAVPKRNPDWRGPWDCAEFASWCAYQAYGLVVGMRPARIDRGDAYSGFWFQDASQPGAMIPWSTALRIEGAVLIRKPRPKLVGHVAIALGDGDGTVEARSARTGVGVFEGAATRPWDVGMLLPGVDYPAADGIAALTTREATPPGAGMRARFLRFRSPPRRGPPEPSIPVESRDVSWSGTLCDSVQRV